MSSYSLISSYSKTKVLLKKMLRIGRSIRRSRTMINMKKPQKQIAVDEDIHYALKRYCASNRKKLGHLTTNILRDFLNGKHNIIGSKGEMIVEGERQKPETLVAVWEDEEEKARRSRSLKDNDIVKRSRSLKDNIVKRGNTFIIKNRA